MDHLSQALKHIEKEMYDLSMTEGENSLRYLELQQIAISLQITIKKYQS